MSFGNNPNFDQSREILPSQSAKIEVIGVGGGGFLGFKPNLINYQLQIINNLKNEFKKNNFPEKIDNIDLTDPNKPKIKVFKP